MIQDYELIKEIKAGSHSAMEVLVKRYYKQIYSYIYRKTTDKEMAYDLTQDVFVKMMKSIGNYQEKASFKTWIYTLAVNHCTDYFRSKSYQVAKLSEEYKEQISAADTSVPFIFERKEKRREMVEAIQSLPDYQSDTIILKYYHELKIKEIAEITQTSESTVKSRLRQGMEKLKALLQRGEDNEKTNRL